MKALRTTGRLLVENLRPLRIDTPPQHTLAQRGALSTLGLMAQGVLRFATSWLVGRIAGKVALGTVQAAISTGTLLALMWPTTTGSAASKYLARARGAGNDEELHAVAAHFRRRAVQSGLLLGLVAVPFWVLYDDGTPLEGLFVGAFTAAYAGYSFIRGVQFGTGQVGRATTWEGVSAVTGLLALAVALLAGVRGPALLVTLTASYAVYAVAGWPRGVRHQAVLAPELRREMDHFVLVGVAGTLASAGFLQIAMVVARGLDRADAGQFAAAMATATPASMLAASLSLVLFPTLAETWGRGDLSAFRAQVDGATRGLVLLMVSVFGAIVICSRLVMTILWGQRFEPSSLVLPVLVFAIMSTNLAVAAVNALSTRSRRTMQVTSAASFAGLVIGAGFWWLWAGRLGIDGVAFGYLAGSLVAAAVPLVTEWRLGGHRWGGLLTRVLAGYGLLAALVAADRLLQPPLAVEPLVALAFVGLWWFIGRHDLRLLPLPPRLRRGLPEPR